LLGGLAGGLAVASKLNGVACCLATVATTVVIVLVASFGRSATSAQRRGARALILAIIVLQAVSLGTFIGINPYFFARPVLPEVTESPPAFVTIAGKRRPRAGAMELQRIARMSVLERFGYLFTYRTSGLSEAVQRFPNDALTTPADRLREIVREGLGRWTFAGRFGVDGMLAGAVTGAIVALGMVVAVALGQRERREGKLPGVWILAVWPVVETAVLLNNLTLNWDRYYMGVVTWASVLAAVAIGGTLNGLKERMVLTPPVRERGE
jgi:hypothetical protein